MAEKEEIKAQRAYDWTVEVQKKNGCWTPTMYNHCGEQIAYEMFENYKQMYPKKTFRVVKNEVEKGGNGK